MHSALAMVTMVALPLTALGQTADPKTDARSLALEGTRVADEGQHERALLLFREAFARYPEPAYLYDIGVECQALGRDVDALDAYNRFLDDPRNTPRSLVTHASELKAELEKRLGEIQLRGAPYGAAIDVDGAPYGTAPPTGPMRAKPGPHRLVIRSAGFEPFRADVQVPEGGAVVVDVAPLAPIEPLAPSSSPRQQWLSWDVALGAGFWTAGPPAGTGPSPAFAAGAGYLLALPDDFHLRLGAKIGLTYLSEPEATDTFVSLLASPRLARSLGNRLSAFAELGLGLLVLSGVPDNSFLLVSSGGRVTGALLTFELRPTLGVVYALNSALSLQAGPTFVWNPSPNERFAQTSMTRFELAIGLAGAL